MATMACISPRCCGGEDEEVRSFCDCPDITWHKKCIEESRITMLRRKYLGLPYGLMQLGNLLTSFVLRMSTCLLGPVPAHLAIDMGMLLEPEAIYQRSWEHSLHLGHRDSIPSIFTCLQCGRCLLDDTDSEPFIFIPNWKATIPFVAIQVAGYLMQRWFMVGMAVWAALVCPFLSLFSVIMIAIAVPFTVTGIAATTLYVSLLNLIGLYIIASPENLLVGLIPIVGGLWVVGLINWMNFQYGIVILNGKWIFHRELTEYRWALDLLHKWIGK